MVRRAWRRPALPPLREAVPSALRVFTAEFGMGSGVLPLAMATRSMPVIGGQRSEGRDQRSEISGVLALSRPCLLSGGGWNELCMCLAAGGASLMHLSLRPHRVPPMG